MIFYYVTLIKRVSLVGVEERVKSYAYPVVSASSDGSIRAWSPHLSHTSDPALVGTHDDYVRCLTSRSPYSLVKYLDTDPYPVHTSRGSRLDHSTELSDSGIFLASLQPLRGITLPELRPIVQPHCQRSRSHPPLKSPASTLLPRITSDLS
jgi:hypothetical protein